MGKTAAINTNSSKIIYIEKKTKHCINLCICMCINYILMTGNVSKVSTPARGGRGIVGGRALVDKKLQVVGGTRMGLGRENDDARS